MVGFTEVCVCLLQAGRQARGVWAGDGRDGRGHQDGIVWFARWRCGQENSGHGLRRAEITPLDIFYIDIMHLFFFWQLCCHLFACGFCVVDTSYAPHRMKYFRQLEAHLSRIPS